MSKYLTEVWNQACDEMIDFLNDLDQKNSFRNEFGNLVKKRYFLKIPDYDSLLKEDGWVNENFSLTQADCVWSNRKKLKFISYTEGDQCEIDCENIQTWSDQYRKYLSFYRKNK